MFTLDSDIVGLQEHIQEFGPIFRQAFKSYVQGDWASAWDNISICLELWDNDGPTLSLKNFMTYYQFQQPESWTGHRDIDEELDYEEIKRQMGNDEDADQDDDANEV